MPQLVAIQIVIRSGVGDGPKHADPKSKSGAVEFDVDQDCTITFNPTIFAKKSYKFRKGLNTLPIAVQSGMTRFTVDYDSTRAVTLLSAAPVTEPVAGGSGPNDIIVP